MTEMVIADFNSTSVAEAAIRDLEDAQIPSAAVKSYSKDEPSYQEVQDTPARTSGRLLEPADRRRADPDAGIRGLRYKPRLRAYRCHSDGG